MLAETVLNGELRRITGTVNYNEPDKYKRAEITGTALFEKGGLTPLFLFTQNDGQCPSFSVLCDNIYFFVFNCHKLPLRNFGI